MDPYPHELRSPHPRYNSHSFHLYSLKESTKYFLGMVIVFSCSATSMVSFTFTQVKNATREGIFNTLPGILVRRCHEQDAFMNNYRTCFPKDRERTRSSNEARELPNGTMTRLLKQSKLLNSRHAQHPIVYSSSSLFGSRYSCKKNPTREVCLRKIFGLGLQ